MNIQPPDSSSSRAESKLLETIRDILLEPLPDGGVPFEFIRARADKALPLLVDAGREHPEIIHDLIFREDYGRQVTHSLDVEAHRTLVRALATIDRESRFITRLALNPSAPWWARAEAIQAVEGRGDTALAEGLLPLFEDPSLGAEILEAGLKAMGACRVVKAAPLIKDLYLKPSPGRALAIAFHLPLSLEVLGILGDCEALRPLMKLQYLSKEYRAIEAGRKGIEGLYREFGGAEGLLPLLRDFDPEASFPERLDEIIRLDADPGVRIWALNQVPSGCPESLAGRLEEIVLHDPHEAVRNKALERVGRLFPERKLRLLLRQLGDDNRECASHASLHLTYEDEPPITELKAICHDPAAPRSQRLWAIYTLLRLGQNIDPGTLGLPDVRVPLEQPVPEQVRRAIIRTRVPDEAQETDVRWLIEYALLEEKEKADQDQLPELLAEALQKAGMDARLLPEWKFQKCFGPASYGEVEADGILLRITLHDGFVAVFRHPIVQGEETPPWRPPSPEFVSRCRKIVSDLGLLWLDQSLLDVKVPGLPGRPWQDLKSPTIGDLLYSLGALLE